jgi:hypothetical protein
MMSNGLTWATIWDWPPPALRAAIGGTLAATLALVGYAAVTKLWWTPFLDLAAFISYLAVAALAGVTLAVAVGRPFRWGVGAGLLGVLISAIVFGLSPFMVWASNPVERSISQLAPWASGIALAGGLVVLAVLTRPLLGALAAASLWPVIFAFFLLLSLWPAMPLPPDIYQTIGLIFLAWAVVLALVVWGWRAPLIIGPSLVLLGGTILLGQSIPGTMTVSSVPPTAAALASRPWVDPPPWVAPLIFVLPLVHWPMLSLLSRVWGRGSVGRRT